jgi:hypothetical protein
MFRNCCSPVLWIDNSLGIVHLLLLMDSEEY